MDIIDFTEEIKLSVSYNDTQRFHHTLTDGYLCHRRKGLQDILPIIKNHDIVVRQHLMLCEMGAYTY